MFNPDVIAVIKVAKFCRVVMHWVGRACFLSRSVRRCCSLGKMLSGSLRPAG